MLKHITEKHFKKSIALLLVLLMALSSFPALASAQTPEASVVFEDVSEIRVYFLRNYGPNVIEYQKTVSVDGFATPPTTPIRLGFNFVGWFLDPAGTIPKNFANPVNPENGEYLPLYARWTPVGTWNPPGPGGAGGGGGGMPHTHSLTFRLYTDNDTILNHFGGYNTLLYRFGTYDTISVPVFPNTPRAQWPAGVLEALEKVVAAIGNLYGTVNEHGYAFWGWFDDQALDASGVERDGLRRPALTDTCRLEEVLISIENGEAVFDQRNIDMFAVWVRWGDANDDGYVDWDDWLLVRAYIMYGWMDPTIEINRRAANVVVDDYVDWSDWLLVREYIMYGWMDPTIVLGRDPDYRPGTPGCDCNNCAEDFYVRYIQLGHINDCELYWDNQIFVITTLAELSTANPGYHTDCNQYPCMHYTDCYEYHGIRPRFPFAVTSLYTDEFFETHYLVILTFWERSGSIWHRVESIDANGNISITRFYPCDQTDDEAWWYIVIEICRNFKPAQFNTVVTDHELCCDYAYGDTDWHYDCTTTDACYDCTCYSCECITSDCCINNCTDLNCNCTTTGTCCSDCTCYWGGCDGTDLTYDCCHTTTDCCDECYGCTCYTNLFWYCGCGTSDWHYDCSHTTTDCCECYGCICYFCGCGTSDCCINSCTDLNCNCTTTGTCCSDCTCYWGGCDGTDLTYDCCHTTTDCCDECYGCTCYTNLFWYCGCGTSDCCINNCTDWDYDCMSDTTDTDWPYDCTTTDMCCWAECHCGFTCFCGYIELSPADNHTFSSAIAGYGSQTPLTVEVLNTGSFPTGDLIIGMWDIWGASRGGFTLDRSYIPSLAVGESVAFTVTPRLGLAPGTFVARIIIHSDDHCCGFGEFIVSFTVESAPNCDWYCDSTCTDGTYDCCTTTDMCCWDYDCLDSTHDCEYCTCWDCDCWDNNCNDCVCYCYFIKQTPYDDHTFPTATFGYGPQTSHTVEFLNTSRFPTEEIRIELWGNQREAFTLSRTYIPCLAVGESATFSVTPATGLTPGTYSSWVTVHHHYFCGGSWTFHVSFTVAPAPAPVRITPRRAQEMMRDYEVVILDVRRLDEFQTGHIENAILLPVNDIQRRALTVIGDTNAIVLVYCRSGVRSVDASQQLVGLGFVNVFDFGGIQSWPGPIIIP